MAKKKLEIEKIYIKRMNEIEVLLNDHQKLIIKNDSTLNKHIKLFKEFVKETKHNSDLNAEEHKAIVEKLNSILDIKVNGTIGLENALRLVYENTKGLRANQKVGDAIRNWFETHKTIKAILNYKPVVIGLTVFIIILLVNIFSIDINLKDLYNFIKSIF